MSYPEHYMRYAVCRWYEHDPKYAVLHMLWERAGQKR